MSIVVSACIEKFDKVLTLQFSNSVILFFFFNKVCIIFLLPTQQCCNFIMSEDFLVLIWRYFITLGYIWLTRDLSKQFRCPLDGKKNSTFKLTFSNSVLIKVILKHIGIELTFKKIR